MTIDAGTPARVPGGWTTLGRGLWTGALSGVLAAALHGQVLAALMLTQSSGTASVLEAVGGFLTVAVITALFSGVVALGFGTVCGVAIAGLSLASTAVEARLPLVAVVVTAVLYGLPAYFVGWAWFLLASSWACGTVAMVVHAVLLRRWIRRRRLAGVPEGAP